MSLGITTESLVELLRAHLCKRGIVIGDYLSKKRFVGKRETDALREIAELFIDATCVPRPIESETTAPIATEIIEHAKALSKRTEG